MKDEIKEILLKDFNEILVKEFCTDWKEKRLYIELLVNSTPFSNLLDYITNLQEENENRISESLSYDLAKAKIKELEYKIDKVIEYINNGYLSDGEMVNILARQDLLEILQGKNGE